MQGDESTNKFTVLQPVEVYENVVIVKESTKKGEVIIVKLQNNNPTSENIKCSNCHEVFTLTDYELHKLICYGFVMYESQMMTETQPGITICQVFKVVKVS